MTQKPVNPRAQKHLMLDIDGDTYEQHVSSVQFLPSGSEVEWRGGHPDAVFTDTSAATWKFEVAVVQDFETVGSLANFLLANEGKKAVVKYRPNADGQFLATATVTIAAPAIGGAVNEFNESTVSMGSTKPVATRSTPPAP